jgi:hypothetical protein
VNQAQLFVHMAISLKIVSKTFLVATLNINASYIVSINIEIFEISEVTLTPINNRETNYIESFWYELKRQIFKTFVSL